MRPNAFPALPSWLRATFHQVLGPAVAVQTVIDERSGRWYNACLRITRDADLAADAVQEALLKAWNHRDDFRGDVALDSWIHRIALNTAIDLIRQRKTRAEDDLDVEARAAAPWADARNRASGRSWAKTCRWFWLAQSASKDAQAHLEKVLTRN